MRTLTMAALGIAAGVILFAVLILVSGCGSTPAPVDHTASAVAACQAGLQHLYAHLGGPLLGPGRFQAAVNAMTFQGSTPKACDSLTHSQVMHLATITSEGK